MVFGSRFLGASPHRILYFWHYLGNLFLTLLSNMLTDLNLSETCYKLFRIVFEPEVTAKIAPREIIQSIMIQENRSSPLLHLSVRTNCLLAERLERTGTNPQTPCGRQFGLAGPDCVRGQPFRPASGPASYVRAIVSHARAARRGYQLTTAAPDARGRRAGRAR